MKASNIISELKFWSDLSYYRDKKLNDVLISCHKTKDAGSYIRYVDKWHEEHIQICASWFYLLKRVALIIPLILFFIEQKPTSIYIVCGISLFIMSIAYWFNHRCKRLDMSRTTCNTFLQYDALMESFNEESK
jgi:hypothetical protein